MNTKLPPENHNRSSKLVRLLVIAVVTLSPCAARADQFDTIRQSWWTSLMDGSASASTVANTANDNWSTMNTSPTRTNLWADLPFGSSSYSIVGTFLRLNQMALAWAKPGCSLQGNAKLAADVASGMDWMVTHAYTPTSAEYGNWFHWEDSGPQYFEAGIVLLYPALTSTRVASYCAALDHFAPPTKAWRTGANRADAVQIVAINGALVKSSAKITLARDNLSPVFPYVTSGEGFYTDGSFVFHTAMAYNGGYGVDLLNRIQIVVNLLQGTNWAIVDPNLSNVFGWVSAGYMPLIYNGSMMDMVRGREMTMTSEGSVGADTLGAISQIALFAPVAQAAEFSDFVSSPRLLGGQFHFASMDRVVAQRANFAFGISMSSSRIFNYESINSDNLHGWFSGDGMTYLYTGAGETQFSGDFWPTVDPYFLPGTTVETAPIPDAAGQHTVTDQAWVGGAQVAGAYGVAGMSLHPVAITTTLFAKKSWFMLDNEIVCLGAGITCGDSATVQTTAENRRLGAPITQTVSVNGTAITPIPGWSTNLSATSPSWCALSGAGGYYFPAGSSGLKAAIVSDSGSWSQIDATGSGTVYTDNYLRLWFNHGSKPTNATYSYVILPGMTAAALSAYAAAPDIAILANTPTIQAVKKTALGVVAANFWAATGGTAGSITANSKASVITRDTGEILSVGVSDPTQANTGSITVTLNQPAASLIWADPSITVTQLTPKIILSANVNGANGQSLQAMFADVGTDTDGDGMLDSAESAAGRNPNSEADLGFEFSKAGDFAGWGNFANIDSPVVTNGWLSGYTMTADPHCDRSGLSFSGSNVNNISVRIRMSAPGSVQLFWARTGATGYAAARSFGAAYTTANTWQTLVFPVNGSAEWAGQTITGLRIDPGAVAGEKFDIEWVRATP